MRRLRDGVMNGFVGFSHGAVVLWERKRVSTNSKSFDSVVNRSIRVSAILSLLRSLIARPTLAVKKASLIALHPHGTSSITTFVLSRTGPLHGNGPSSCRE